MAHSSLGGLPSTQLTRLSALSVRKAKGDGFSAVAEPSGAPFHRSSPYLVA